MYINWKWNFFWNLCKLCFLIKFTLQSVVCVPCGLFVSFSPAFDYLKWFIVIWPIFFISNRTHLSQWHHMKQVYIFNCSPHAVKEGICAEKVPQQWTCHLRRGNETRTVAIATIAKSRLAGFRRPSTIADDVGEYFATPARPHAFRCCPFIPTQFVCVVAATKFKLRVSLCPAEMLFKLPWPGPNSVWRSTLGLRLNKRLLPPPPYLRHHHPLLHRVEPPKILLFISNTKRCDHSSLASTAIL